MNDMSRTMDDYLGILLNASVLLFAVSSMLATGLTYTWKDILHPLRNRRTVRVTLIANFVMVPALAWFIIRVMGLDHPLNLGLFLVASAAGAPFLIKLTMAAGQDVAVSAALLVLLVPATILFMPLIIPLVFRPVRIDGISIALPLLLSMLLPLAAGLLIRARSERRADPVLPGWSGHPFSDRLHHAANHGGSLGVSGGIVENKVDRAGSRIRKVAH